MNPASTILFFDGVCNLCNSSVQFVVKRLRKESPLKIAPLQGNTALQTLPKNQQWPDSLILMRNGQFFVESDAALELAKELKGAWKLLWLLKIFPRAIRNLVYRWVAKNRYRWFGKQEHCMLPTPEYKQLFLD